MSTRIGSASFASGTWLPSDDGFLGFNSDPAAASGGGLLVAGTAYLARLPIRSPQLISNLWVCVSTIGAGTANGYSGAWIVSGTTGAVLAQAADQTAAFTGTTGWKQLPLTVPVTAGGGVFPYAVILTNLLTTQVSLVRQLNAASQNSPQTVNNPSSFRWASQAAFGAAVGPVNLASNANSSFSNMVGWS